MPAGSPDRIICPGRPRAAAKAKSGGKGAIPDGPLRHTPGKVSLAGVALLAMALGFSEAAFLGLVGKFANL